MSTRSPAQGSTSWYPWVESMHSGFHVDRGLPGAAFSGATRVVEGAIFSATSAGLGSIYYPFVMRVDEVLDTPIDTYYMWFSQDHAGDGQINLATAPTRSGPWTYYGIVTTTALGTGDAQGPSVIYNPDDPATPFWLYYQRNAMTALIKSADGVTWVAGASPVIDVPRNVENSADVDEQPGQIRTGYSKVMKIGTLWMSLHVFGGGAYSHYAQSWSYDGLDWHTDPRLLFLNSDLSQDPANQFTLLDAVQVGGQWWGLGILGPAANFRIAAAPLASNLRSYIGRPRVLIQADQAWDGALIRSFTLMVDEGRLFIYYSTDNNAVGLAEVS